MPLPSKREATAISDHRKPSGEAVDFKEYLRAGPDFDDLDLSGRVLDEQPDWPMFEGGGTPALSDEVTQAVARGAAKQSNTPDQLNTYDESMTTRDDLHHLVDRIDSDELEAAEIALRRYAEHLQPPLPSSLGIGHSGHSDLSERADELLTEACFGQ